MMLRAGRLGRLIFAGEPGMLCHACHVTVTDWVLCMLKSSQAVQLAGVMESNACIHAYCAASCHAHAEALQQQE